MWGTRRRYPRDFDWIWEQLKLRSFQLLRWARATYLWLLNYKSLLKCKHNHFPKRPFHRVSLLSVDLRCVPGKCLPVWAACLRAESSASLLGREWDSRSLAAALDLAIGLQGFVVRGHRCCAWAEGRADDVGRGGLGGVHAEGHARLPVAVYVVLCEAQTGMRGDALWVAVEGVHPDLLFSGFAASYTHRNWEVLPLD